MADHIQVGDVIPRAQYAANGSQTAFTFTFPIFTAADLEVWLGAVKQATSTYSISGVGISGGGTVLFAVPPANNTLVTLRRRLAIARTGDYQEDGIIRAKVLNDEFDYQTAALQQVAEDADRAVKRSFLSSDSADLTLPEPSAGRAIKWNATATGLENSAADTDQVLAGATTQAAAAAASQSAALASATAASASASGASASASSAHASELSALGSASSATASANAAAISAANAHTSETNAAISAGNSHTSETNAATSAASASGSALAAETSASAASASATTASTQASAAAGSASTAITQAANATASATSAAASAAAASAAASGGAVKVSATDTTANYLQSKLVAGANITLTRSNAGTNETLSLAVTGLGSVAALTVDTDAALAANSDSRIPSQKAVRAYVAANGGISATDFTSLQQDVIQNYLLDAINGAWAAGAYSNGGYDAFASDTIGGTSTSQTYDATNKLYSNTGSPAQHVPTGSTFGNMTASGGLAASFDGSTSKVYTSCSVNLATNPAYVGKAFASAQAIAQVIVYGANNGGYSDASPGSAMTISVYGKSTSPSSATDGTLLGSVGPFSDSNATNPKTITCSGAAYQYVWVVVSNGSANSASLAQVQYYTVTAPPNMTLASSALSPAPVSAPTQVKLMALWKDLSGSAVLNTDLTAEATRDGASWSAGTLSDTGLTISGFKVLWAVADVSGQPSGTTVKYRLKTLNTKSQQIKGVALMSK